MSDPLHIDNFEIVSRLGQGGMATVWKARQASLDRFVAIKVLAASFATDPADVARFRDEARAAGRLKHPGIVQVYDANFKDGSYYFVMELVDGYTVGEWIRRKGRIAEADALTVAESVIGALDYAWSQFGIIHCDIKSENIMVDADGSLKITDLGLARAITAMHAKETEAEVLGTPAYMAPEQVTGQPDLDCRVDIYGLGATLYHMVTGHTLFAGADADEIMQKQLVASVSSPAQEVPGLSRAFVLLLAKLLAKDRKYRPQDWKAVMNDLHRVRSGHGPAGDEPPPGASTVFLNAQESDTVRRRALEAARTPEAQPDSDGLRVVRLMLLLLAAGAVGGGAWFLLGRSPAAPGAVDAVPRPAAGPPPMAAALPQTRAEHDRPVAPLNQAEHPDERRPPPMTRPPANSLPAVNAPPPREVKAHEPREGALTADESVRRVSRVLLRKGIVAAQMRSADLLRNHPELADTELAGMQVILTQAVSAQQSVLDTFDRDMGKKLTVPLVRETVQGTVARVENGRVHLTLAGGADRSFAVDDLDVQERLKRLGHAGDDPGGTLLKGLWAYRTRALEDRAKALFATLAPPLGPALIAAMEERSLKGVDGVNVDD